MDLNNKIALFCNESGVVTSRHYMPWELLKDQLNDAFVFDKNDTRLIEPAVEPWENAVLYLKNGEPLWKTDSVQIDSVLKYKLVIQLRREGLLQSVEDLVYQAGEDVRTAWETAPEIRRNSPAVEQLQQALELDPEYVDEIFAKASTIEL